MKRLAIDNVGIVDNHKLFMIISCLGQHDMSAIILQIILQFNGVVYDNSYL